LIGEIQPVEEPGTGLGIALVKQQDRQV